MYLDIERRDLPIREVLRLAALDSYQIVDTPPEEKFDAFVIAASQRFKTPISLISLVDEKRQWFKARIGLSAAETDREHAFCVHVIDNQESLIVRDATLDARFAANPLVTGGPGIRFYAGAPLVTPLKRCLGTLNVIDTVPRPSWSDHHTLALEEMAAAVMAELERRRGHLVIGRALGNRPH